VLFYVPIRPLGLSRYHVTLLPQDHIMSFHSLLEVGVEDGDLVDYYLTNGAGNWWDLSLRSAADERREILDHVVGHVIHPQTAATLIS
jgi:hypothetical protein